MLYNTLRITVKMKFNKCKNILFDVKDADIKVIMLCVNAQRVTLPMLKTK